MCLDNGAKIEVIRANKGKYKISSMCKYLIVARSTVYKEKKDKKYDTELDNSVIKTFYENRSIFGTRKIKVELAKQGRRVSRGKIGKIMKKYNLVSKYTLKNKPKHTNNKVNEDPTANLLNRQFNDREVLEAVVSDLTYVKVGGIWRYTCLLLDIGCRKILGYAAGNHKDAELVMKAFYSADCDLRCIKIFHTDRGSEFKNKLIDDIINTFGIKRSLSAKGTPIDNAVAEAMYKVFKTEFVFAENFDNMDDFQLKLFDYVNWYNNVRPHGSLNYLTPNEAFTKM
jgi:transposase InsO family protein